MPVEVYGHKISAPCRLVFMTCEAAKVPYDFKVVDLMKGDNMKEEYLKLNPQHTIPTLKDGDLVITESRAAAMYIANKHCEKLYPKDPCVRAMVDQRICFDMGSFYSAFGATVYPILLRGEKIADGAVDKLKEILCLANKYVKKTGYVAGTNHLTLADIAFLATYSTLKACCHVDLSPYADLCAWFEKVSAEVPNYASMCGEGAAMFGGWYNSAKKP